VQKTTKFTRKRHFTASLGQRVWYFWKPQEANVEVCWQRGCRIAVEWYKTCRHFSVRTTASKKESDYRRSKSHKSEGGARKEIDTSIDCMSLTNSHLSLLSGSRDILGTVQQNDDFYNEPQSRMSSIEICFFFVSRCTETFDSNRDFYFILLLLLITVKGPALVVFHSENERDKRRASPTAWWCRRRQKVI
jgi:hypothetical protein